MGVADGKPQRAVDEGREIVLLAIEIGLHVAEARRVQERNVADFALEETVPAIIREIYQSPACIYEAEGSPDFTHASGPLSFTTLKLPVLWPPITGSFCSDHL